MKENLSKRILSLMLAFAMVFSLAVPAGAAGHDHDPMTQISFEEVNADSGLERLGQTTESTQAEPGYEDTDIVRVSILLDQASTLQAGFSTMNVAENAQAMSYRDTLKQQQSKVTASIEKALDGRLDVVWNLTLAANLISANVAYGDIAKISAVPGVSGVILENEYEPMVVADSAAEEADPNLITSTIMTGTVNVWNNGYTGAGSRVAVIDTGIDTDHQSFSAKGLEYSLALNAEKEGKTLEAYYEELDLLDEEEIESLLDQLNIEAPKADRLYISSKIPFGYNYIDQNYKVTHDYDSQGEHGSHVEGIAAANAYIPQRDGTFADSLALTNAVGQAPDAQIISMKVFGVNGGAYDSDYMAAIEDAIVLGADSVNLSLGSGSAGFSFNATYAELLEGLRNTDTVVTISAGNSYSWDDEADHRLYVEDIRFATNGSPGSYSNSLCVASVESTYFNEDGTYTEPAYYEMSDFSSWGVPESLELKPEITAPGGNIWSVNGAVAGGKSYETMSGTSMAAPQMAGIAAVMAEYIRDNGLVEKTGLSVRQLSQSLLMSTALPLIEEDSDYYYSVLKQGAGMAQLDDATAAQSYILMGDDATAYAADGKVKAELGDDAERAGVYSFRFTIHNFGDTDAAYRLRTELFTQYTNGTCLYGTTDALAANVTYVVDGAAYVPVATAVECDLNADGVTDAADAEIILSYCLGDVTEIDAVADLDASGVVDSYDAHLILAGLETGEFPVKAGQSVSVTVTAALTEEQKAELDEKYPNGAYIEGYVFAAGTDVTHSIPMLGFYGNWSDPNMFGVSYTDYLYGDDRDPYFGSAENNNLVISSNGQLWLQTGNPYLVEESYPEGKAAVNSGDVLDSYRLTLLRNAGAIMLSILDENGNELYNSGVTNRLNGAYYYVNGGTWRNTSADYALGFTAAGLGLEENDRFTVTVTAIPEYYILGQTLNKDQVYEIVNSGILGQGASLTTELVVDDTAPQLISIARDIETGELVVTVSDNQNVAALQIMDADGVVHATEVPDAGTTGGLQQIILDLEGVKACDPCYLSIGDYAGNESVYEASLGLESGSGEGGGSGTVSGGNLFGFSAHTANGWIQADPTTGSYSVKAKANVSVEAAEYVDGYVFLVSTGGTLYVAPHGNWSSTVELADLSAYGVEDMAFNYTDNRMYVLGAGNVIYTMDLLTGALTEQFTVHVKNSKNAACTTLQGLAVDESGSFYVACDGGSGYEFAAQFFTFTLDMVTDGAIHDLAPMGTGYVGGYTDNGQTLAWDHENDLLYYYSQGRYNIDSFGTIYFTGYSKGGLRSNYAMTKIGLSAMYFPGLTANVIDFATEAESLTVSIQDLMMLEGSSVTIGATITPWTLKDQSMTWVSSDESVVAVNNGVAYAVGQGEATITVTTNAAPNLSASIHVTVSGVPELDVKALLLDTDGTPTWVSFNTTEPEAWVTEAYNEGSDSYGAVNLNDVIYVHDGSTLYAMNPDTYTKEAVSGLGSSYAWPDAAEAPAIGRIVAPCFDGTGIAVIEPGSKDVVDFDVSDTLAGDLLVTMAYAGGYGSSEEGNFVFYSVAESGNVYKLLLTAYDDGTYDLSIARLCSSNLELSGASGVGGDSTAASVYDAESGTLVIASYCEGDSTGYVYALEPNGGSVLKLGSIGDAVWPFYSLYTYTAPEELTLRVRTQSLSLYVGDEGKVSAAVSPLSFTGGLAFTAADETVVSVDAAGNVVALAPGDTTITVSTVDTDANGNPLSAVVPVHVEDVVDIDLTVQAKLDFDDEGSKWVSIDTTDIKNPTVIADDHVYLSSAAVHDGIIYANDGKYYIDWNYWAVVSNLYIIEPEYDYDITPGGLIGAGNMPTDMTTMPGMTLTYTDAEGNEASIVAGDMPIYMDISEQLIMWNVAASGEVADLSGWNLSGTFEGTPGAIAYLGMTTQPDDDGVERDAWSYGVLTDAGALYTISIVPYAELDEDGTAYVDYSAFIDYMGNVGLEFEYSDAMNMIYVNDGEHIGLLVGYTSDVAELYYVDINVQDTNVTFDSGKVGSIPGTNTFAGMYFPEELNPSGEAPQAMANRGKLVQKDAQVGPDRTYQVPSRLTNDRLTLADGSLAAVQGTARIQSDIQPGENTAALNLTEDVNVTNGVVVVTFDPAVLTYTGSASEYLTAEKAADGKLTLAYASGHEVAAGKLLATLNFAYTGEYGSTAVTVETIQRNAEGTVTGETETVELTYEVGGHDYQVTDEQAPTCTEDGYKTYVCAKCGDTYTETLAATGHSYTETLVEPTCTEGGYTEYTCACGDSYRDNFVEATGHHYEAEVVAPTCTEMGYTVYTCSACGDSYTSDFVDTYCPASGFTDVDLKLWYHASIDFVVAKGLMNGVSATVFNPDGAMTRGQLVTVLYRLAGSPEAEQDVPFTDVADGRYYTAAVAWAYANGIAKGTSADKFSPDASVTREQMVTFFARYAKLAGMTVEAEGGLSAFADADQVKPYARASMAWAVETGLINGVTSTTLEPAGTATRAQVAAVLTRFVQLGE